MCITAEGDGQTDTKHVKTLPRNVCSRTLIACEFQSNHPQHQKGELFLCPHPTWGRTSWHRPSDISFPSLRSRQPHNSFVTKDTLTFRLAFLFCVDQCTGFNLLTEACATFCLYYVRAFCSHGKFNYIVTNIGRFFLNWSAENNHRSQSVSKVSPWKTKCVGRGD